MPGPQGLGSALRLLREAADRTVLLTMLGTMLVVALSGALAAGSPLVLKHLVDAVTATPSSGVTFIDSTVLMYGTAYLIALLGGRLASDVRPLLASRVEQRVLSAMRQRFLAHLLRLPMAELTQRRGGELLHSVDLAAAGAQAIISHIANSIAPVVIELSMMIVILARLGQPELVVLFVGTSVLYLAVFTWGVLRQQRAIHALSAASLDVHAQLSDGINHNETLRCFGAVAQAEHSLVGASARLASGWLRFNLLTVESALAASAIFALALATCLWISADAVTQGQLTVGGFVLATVYMLQVARPLEMMGAAARDLSRASGFMTPLLDILATPVEPELTRQPSPTAAMPPARSPSIRFEDLTFGYEPQRPVIRGLNLEIPAGHTIAIVGRNGCGKSSLVRLLLRLCSPQSGRILVDGEPIENLPTTDLRALIGLVPQDCGLLQTTVASNIALGLPTSSRDDVELAAMRAQIHDLVRSLPHGYDTQLGDRGQTVSGGERQRLAIARAILRRPRIFVLDEPTSMLDAKTEADVLLALRGLTAGCTTIVIAHRLSTVMHADEIVVLDGGQVRERGRHPELLASGGLYAQLWRQQTEVPD